MRVIEPDHKVLLRMPNWVGDHIAAEPLVRELHARLRDRGRLSLAGPSHLAELLAERFPGVQHLETRGQREGVGWAGHDWALLLNGSLRSAVAAWRAGIPGRVGLASGGRAPFLTHPLGPARERGGVPLGLGRPGSGARLLPRPFGGVVAELGEAAGVRLGRPRPLLVPTEEARWRSRQRLRDLGLDADQPFVLVNVGARAGSSKALPTDSWALLVSRLAERTTLPLLLTAGPGEESSIEAVLDRAGTGGRGGQVLGVNDPVPGLPELVALCAQADAVLCTDGGVRHVARAVHAPALVLYGPTDPRHTAEHSHRERHLRHQVDCGPCHLELCPEPAPGRHRCMRELPLDEALEAAVERIEEGGRVRALG